MEKKLSITIKYYIYIRKNGNNNNIISIINLKILKCRGKKKKLINDYIFFISFIIFSIY